MLRDPEFALRSLAARSALLGSPLSEHGSHWPTQRHDWRLLRRA